MKNKKLLNLFSAICFLILFFTVFVKSSEILELKKSDVSYSEFWENPAEYDVWFMGTSHMLYAVSPMCLYKDYGIKSYNIAGPASRLPQMYWTFMCALDYSEPKVVVLDTYHVDKDYLYEEAKDRLHIGFDAIPMSITKARAILDIYQNDYEKLVEYMANFYIYHNRWEELSEDDFEVVCDPRKGNRIDDHIYDNSYYQLIPQDERLENTDTIGFQYLRKIIEECKERDIKIILTALPMYKYPEFQKGMNTVSLIAEEYSIPFLNIPYENNPLDVRFDFADIEHMNPSGCYKMTKYLGNYLVQNFEIEDCRNNTEATKRWDTDYANYEKYIIKEMKKQKKLKRYLLWLRNEHYNCYIYTNDRIKGTESKLLQDLFTNISNKQDIDYKYATELLQYDFDADYAFIIMNENNDRVIDTALFTNGKRCKIEIQ